MRIDERSAGFLALGMARTSRRPVPVVTTSGTAVANHPAVLEAAHAGLPLVVLSADRPAGLRGTNANQTTDQVKIFGGAVRAFADVPPAFAGTRGVNGVSEGHQVASWRSLVARHLVTATGRGVQPAGPVHLNVQFTDPLTPDVDGGWTDPATAVRTGSPGPGPGPGAAAASPSPRDAAPWWSPATTPGRRRGCSPSVPAGRCSRSPPAARARANAIRTYRLLLADEELAGRIEQVVSTATPPCPGR